ncbi:MAG: flagellar filament capping protein FliD, partial [Planctomycetota bacterium]
AAVADPTILTAKPAASPPPGSYTFTVGRLASNSQVLSRGFATRNLNPVGLDSMSFEWGDAGLTRDVPLAELNGGEGVRRGSIRITDRLARVATLDLSTAVTLNDVVERINALSGIAVNASIQNERLVIRDETNGSGNLLIEDLGVGAIANDLGIAGTSLNGTTTGAQINGLGSASSLGRLNDGGGVLIRDGVADFRISVDGTSYDISLGRIDTPISAATKLSDLRNGVGIRINTTDADDFTVVAANGVSVGINLGAVVVGGDVESEAVKTVGEMIARVNSELDATLGAGKVVMSLRPDGKGFVLTDTTGGSGPVKVLGAGPNGEGTARDLGLFTGAIDSGPTTLTGAIVRNKVATPRATTIGDVMQRIAAQTNGAVTATIDAGATGITLTAAGGGAISVLAGTGDGSSFGTTVGERTARDLGIFGLSGTGSVTGTRVAGTIGSVALSQLNGGAGIGAPTGITLTDRAGNSATFSNFAAHRSIASLVSAINLELKASGVEMKVEVGGSGRGLSIVSTGTGTGTMSASGDGATALGIAVSGASDRLAGADLERQTASLATEVASLNFGKGIGKGTFRITDSSGESSIVDIDSDTVTLYDLVSEINSRGLFVEARMNSTGDGIELVDTNTGTPSTKMKVEDVNGSIGRSLGILGEAATVGGNISGAFERSVDLDATDTLDDVVRKINAAGIPVSAAVINAGSGATPFRLSLSSTQGGSLGQLWVDTGGVDIGLVRAVEGRDATLFLGSGNPETSFLFTSSSNTFKDVVSGLEVTALKAGQTTQVDVARNEQGIFDAVKQLVTTVNDALGRIRDYDKYDIETKKKGPLLGNSTVAQVRQQIIQAAQGPAKGVDGRYRFLSQVGIRFGKEGKLVLDEAKFKAAYATDPQAVEDLFTAFEIRSTSSSSPVDGVTVENQTTTYSKLGFSDIFDQLLKKLTNSVDGITTLADRQFQKQIDELNTRIDRFDQRLTSKRTRLESQFAGMEAALARLQAQQGSLGSIVANMGGIR